MTADRTERVQRTDGSSSRSPIALVFDPIRSLDWSYEIERDLLGERDVELVVPASDDEALSLLPMADIVIVSEWLPTELIAALDRCVGLLSYRVGLDTFDVDVARAAGIPVANVAGYCTEEVSDHGLALLLAATRRLLPFARAASDGDWDVYGWPEFRAIRRLRGRTLGIIGAGRIGSRVAVKAHAFGVETIAYDPHLTQSPVEDLHLVSLDELLARSAMIVLCSALTGASRHLIDRRAISRMQDGVILVNVARGGLIDEVALMEGLRSGRVGVAALDVRADEPPGASDEMRKLPNVILTPHLAATSVESHADLHAFAAAEVLRLLEGARLLPGPRHELMKERGQVGTTNAATRDAPAP
jgi:D-3-phosphoglycerate dehydrogenase / 2-oxoglutarate reductase